MSDVYAAEITLTTLIGVDTNKYPVRHGNCFSVKADDGGHYRIVNFAHENVEELIRRGVNFPYRILPLSKEVAVIHDNRIPPEWYRDHFCSVCCPEELLPMPQKLTNIRLEECGYRTKTEVDIINGKKICGVICDPKKYPRLPGEGK